MSALQEARKILCIYGEMNMSDEMEFFIFLLEQYSYFKHRSAKDVLQDWDDHSITEKIYSNYWYYHTEALENAFKDIDSLMATGEHAW